MKFLIGIVSTLAIFATYPTRAAVNYTNYEGNLVFMVWNSQGTKMNLTTNNNATFVQMCPPTSNWTLISHAWHENFQKEWPQSMVDNFLKLRGGCVMFMDYG